MSSIIIACVYFTRKIVKKQNDGLDDPVYTPAPLILPYIRPTVRRRVLNVPRNSELEFVRFLRTKRRRRRRRRFELYGACNQTIRFRNYFSVRIATNTRVHDGRLRPSPVAGTVAKIRSNPRDSRVANALIALRFAPTA